MWDQPLSMFAPRPKARPKAASEAIYQPVVTSSDPEIDVVVVSWNVRDDLMRCLAAVDRSVGVSTKLVVVDNDSRDGSANAVEERFGRAALMRLPTNEGFARAANRGIRSGSSPYVLLLNPDAEV